jgi:hypothetical protein
VRREAFERGTDRRPVIVDVIGERVATMMAKTGVGTIGDKIVRLSEQEKVQQRLTRALMLGVVRRWTIHHRATSVHRVPFGSEHGDIRCEAKPRILVYHAVASDKYD